MKKLEELGISPAPWSPIFDAVVKKAEAALAKAAGEEATDGTKH